jgi:hypothetical protein
MFTIPSSRIEVEKSTAPVIEELQVSIAISRAFAPKLTEALNDTLERLWSAVDSSRVCHGGLRYAGDRH